MDVNQQDNQEIINEEEAFGDDVDLDMVKEKIIKLKEKLKKCQEERQGYLVGWQREKADFINFKRRQEEQAGEWLKMAQAGLIKDLLAIADSLELGIKNWESGNGDENHLDWILKQLKDIFRKYGVEEIKSVGEKFNPEFHEAVESVKSADSEEGKIVEEVQKGYLLNSRVLRVAKVKVVK